MSALALYVIGAGTILPAASGYRACHLPDGSLRIDPNWRLLMTTSTTDNTWLAGCRHEPSFLWAVSLAALAASAANSRPAAGGVAHPPKKLRVPVRPADPDVRRRTSMHVDGRFHSERCRAGPDGGGSVSAEPAVQTEAQVRVCDNLLYEDQETSHVRSVAHLRAVLSRTPTRDSLWRRQAASGVRALPSNIRAKSDSRSTTKRDDRRHATASSSSPKCLRSQQSCQIRARCSGKKW